MRLYSSDEKKMVDVGTGTIWYSLYSTAVKKNYLLYLILPAPIESIPDIERELS